MRKKEEEEKKEQSTDLRWVTHPVPNPARQGTGPTGLEWRD